MQTWADEVFAKIVKKYEKSAALAAEQKVIPYFGESGRWVSSPYDGNSWWTNGFWSGLMWQLYVPTQKEIFKAEALRVEKLLQAELMAFDKLHHDVGFMYLPSSGVHFKLTDDETAKRDLLHAATLLAGRFNPVGYISAWNQNRPGWAIVDCMMNLTLLYQASELTGDPRFANVARIHADTSIREFVRGDGSCNHIVIFDPLTGKALEKPGGQGYEAGSSWSRGQAWGLYGFTLSYLHTKEQRYLETACRIADYFIANIRPDGLTDCDFRQPKEEERIDNIAGACAACGLLELAKQVDAEKAQSYQEAALRMLQALDTLCADWTDDCPGILQKCTASYHNDGAGRHVNIIYGDYYFVEALCKLRGTDVGPWMPIKGE
ncbi:MAG: glycoside hydrolase family 88 protein [Eubacteriales bacterium]|nr:glycoside hydrolase family 88 protein [Eubacteriales bacterium]